MKEIENFISNEESDYLMQYHKENFNLNKKGNFMWRGTEVIDIGELPKFKELKNKFNNLVKSEDKDHVVSYFQIVRWPTGEWQPPHLDLYGHTYSSILYLNDDYEGGETVVLNETAAPKKNNIAKMLRTPRFRQLVIKNKKKYNRKKNKNESLT